MSVPWWCQDLKFACKSLIWRMTCLHFARSSRSVIAMHLYATPEKPHLIPVIDISKVHDPAGLAEAAHQVREACLETGFFYVTGHGVPADFVAAQFAAARAFFALPLEDKLAIHMRQSPSTAGYEPIGGQSLDSQDSDSEKAPPDLKETFYCCLELPQDHPLSLRKMRGYGHNQWPAALPDFSGQMIDYYARMSALGDRILSIIGVSLDLEPDWFKPFYAPGSATQRLIHYPPQPARAAFNQMGAGAHTDWGGITILAQDDAGGLEVRTVDDKWIEATPIPESFVVNLGDLMARWTNGVYRSNLHRVMTRQGGRDRYSVPFFYSPSPDSIIEPMPTCLGEGRPRQFATCTAAEHMGEMFRRSYGYSLAS